MFDPKIRFKLFKKHNYFCSAPWNLLYVGVDGKIQICTKSGINLNGDLTNSSIEEILNSKDYQNLRRDILDDKITHNCQDCLKHENIVHGKKFSSIRNHYNNLSKFNSVDHTDITKFNLAAVDLHWSSICDLKCITCWAKQSSSIAREQNQSVIHTPTEIANKIINYIVNNQSELKEIYLSGGEPTLIKHNLKLLKQIEKTPDLQLRVNSNLQWNKDNPIIKEILKFPNVMFTCSIDGIGKKFEYIRRNGQWKKFVENLDYLNEHSNVDIRGNTVFFVLTAQELPQIIDFMVENYKSIDHTVNLIGMGKTFLRARNLPESVKEKSYKNLEISLEKYKDNLSISGCIKNCLYEIETANSEDYKEYLDQIDKLQGSSWRSLYPELE